MRNWIDILIFVVIALFVGFIIDVYEDKISSLETNQSKLITENNYLKFQLQKQCHTDIETVIELERVMHEMSGE